MTVLMMEIHTMNIPNTDQKTTKASLLIRIIRYVEFMLSQVHPNALLIYVDLYFSKLPSDAKAFYMQPAFKMSARLTQLPL